MPRFEFRAGSSKKFWEIALSGTSLKTTYGRIGATGQSTSKEYDSEEQAKKEYDKLIAEKTKKGYVEVGKASAPKAASDENPRTTAAALAKAWKRPLPDAVAKLLSSPNLAKLAKLTFTLRYAGEHKARPIFEPVAAFDDLAAWMDDVGLGEIDWPSEKGDYEKRLPLALIKAADKQSYGLEKDLLAVGTDDPKCPVYLWTEGSFFPLFPSLDAFLAELEGRVENPIDVLNRVIRASREKSDAGKHRESVEILREAIAEFEGKPLEGEAKKLLGLAYNRAGYSLYQLKEIEPAEKLYEKAAALGRAESARNLMLMAAQDHRDWDMTLKRCKAYYDGCYSRDARIEVRRYEYLAYAMKGDLSGALEALSGLEKRYFADDDFTKIIDGIRENFEGLEATEEAKAALAELARLGAKWAAARAPKHYATPREWWDSLDEVWRNVLHANLDQQALERIKQGRSSNIAFDTQRLSATDEQLAQIIALRALKLFTVRKDTRYLNPRSLAPLSYLVQLEAIDAEDARESYSLDPLRGLDHLRSLNLLGTKVSDLGPISGKPIAELNIKQTEVKDLAPVSTLKNLRRFNCWLAPVTDLSPLAACTSLEEIVAGNTKARVLPLLPELTNLKHLDVCYARFERKQANAFKKAHPGCNVEYSLNKD